MNTVSFGDGENVWDIDRGGSGTQYHWIVYLKMVNFLLCEFHHNKNIVKKKKGISESQHLGLFIPNT